MKSSIKKKTKNNEALQTTVRLGMLIEGAVQSLRVLNPRLACHSHDIFLTAVRETQQKQRQRGRYKSVYAKGRESK